MSTPTHGHPCKPATSLHPDLAHGFAQMPRPVLRCPELSRDARLLYALLTDYAYHKRGCWPSQATLAADMGCSVDSIATYTDELVAWGLVSVKRRGLGHTNIYTLLPLDGNPRLALPAREVSDSAPERIPESAPMRVEEKEVKEEEKKTDVTPLLPEIVKAVKEAREALGDTWEEDGAIEAALGHYRTARKWATPEAFAACIRALVAVVKARMARGPVERPVGMLMALLREEARWWEVDKGHRAERQQGRGTVRNFRTVEKKQPALDVFDYGQQPVKPQRIQQWL